ncbi:MAG TPA: lytic transglycosylase domain-containing protein [Bryobacteraceae bacterium]|nr:lytic transglycosylase domain-containing protein [Bryobacteraceae bacterium]
MTSKQPQTQSPLLIPPVFTGGQTASSTPSVADLVQDAAERYQVDPLLVHSVIHVESGFNPRAVSDKGAQGLMQLIPATAHRFGVTDPFDPKQNIDAGVHYLRYLQDRFSNDLSLSIAAYNAGEGAVTRYNSIPPYPETVNYVQKVTREYTGRKQTAKPSRTDGPPTPAQISSSEEAVRHVEQYVDSEGRLYLRTR